MTPDTVPAAIRELRDLVATVPSKLISIGDQAAAEPRAPGKWSRKQVLGHLTDSATNNHQRFVRAAIAGELRFPPYEADPWTDVQRHQERHWSDLVRFWEAYNRHLLHVIERLPASRLDAKCIVESKEPVTLEFLVRDYVAHLKHHLEQILA